MEDRVYQTNCFYGKFSTYTLFFPTNSINKNKAYQLYSQKCGLYAPYHLVETNGEIIDYTLDNFISDYGVPTYFIFDGSLVKTDINSRFNQLVHKNGIDHHWYSYIHT